MRFTKSKINLNDGIHQNILLKQLWLLEDMWFSNLSLIGVFHLVKALFLICVISIFYKKIGEFHLRTFKLVSFALGERQNGMF